MKIKELQKTVNIAWSPQLQDPIYLTAGTAAQQFDSNVSSTLEIYSTNFGDPSYDLQLKASLPSQYRYQKLIWTPTGFGTTHKNGLIIGGCEGGHIMIYSASKLLDNEECLIARQDKHSGPVSGLDINQFQTNLLASCASESEIFIWDLNNTSTHMSPGVKTQPFEDVQNVAWNRQVQHILASVFSSRCVIWDLRKSEQIIKLSDTQSRVRWHAIQWHPEIATQVWLASEDDQAPLVQLWDLRYATAPAKSMQIHQRGVLGMSWCSSDTDLMVSCGKDNRIYCWNTNTDLVEGEILCEVATTATWYSDVQWCPRNPAVIASSSLDGNVSIYSLCGGVQKQVQTANKIADSFPGMEQIATDIPQQASQIVYHDLKRAPKWIKRPCSASFAFGGKLVSFNSKAKTVNISQVITDQKLVERAKALENSLNECNFIEYCRNRADEMSDQSGRYLWYFIKANFEINPREEMLNLLGYSKEDVDSKFAKYNEKDEQLVRNDVDNLTDRFGNLIHKPVDNDAVFDGIAAEHKLNEIVDEKKKLKSNFKIPTGDHVDSEITEALLTGNLEAAAELCLNSKRPSEALIIASTAGIEFLTKIQNRYLQDQESDLSNVITALVTRDWMEFVTRCSLDSWKEALVAALRHSERKVVDICERLGDRLLSDNSSGIENKKNALLCYICSGSVDKLVEAFYQLKQVEHQNENYKLNTVELQEIAEVVMLMCKSLQRQGIALELSKRFYEFICEYGGLLTSQGALTAALAYINALGSNENLDLDEFRERIYNAVASKRTLIPGKADLQQQQRKFQPHLQNQQEQQNIYNPQQQQLGSYSQTKPLNYAGMPTNQLQSNGWNALPSSTQPAVATAGPGVLRPIPNFNPLNPTAVPQSGNIKPLTQPLVENDGLKQPPRPLSNSSQTGNSLHSRSKYVLDPSVAPATSMGTYGQLYNPTAQIAGPTLQGPNAFNTTPFNTNNMDANSFTNPMNMTPTFNPRLIGGGNNFVNSTPADTTSVLSTAKSIRNPTPPPGWNDPPALNPSKTSKPNMPTPITQPLYNVDRNQNGYLDPNAPYQNTGISGGLPPPPPMGGLVNSYQNTGSYLKQQTPHPPVLNNNATVNTQQFPQQRNYLSPALPIQEVQENLQQQHQQWNSPIQNVGFNEQPAPIEQKTELAKEKPPLPEEFIYLHTVLDELKNQCLSIATDPRTKRKFVDVAKRLENLYDCLRENRLTPPTISALNQMVQFIQIGDYNNALQIQTQIAFGSDFSQCAGFMPGLKVLVQSGSELQIYLR